MTGVFFDTHANVKKLREAGFTERQAEVQTEILSQLVEKDLVTKGYLDIKLKELESRLSAQIQQSKVDMMKWMTLLLLAQGGMVAALVKLL